MEINLSRSNEKNINDVRNDDDRVKSLTETAEKLRISVCNWIIWKILHVFFL
jgi:hypothetical protein